MSRKSKLKPLPKLPRTKVWFVTDYNSLVEASRLGFTNLDIHRLSTGGSTTVKNHAASREALSPQECVRVEQACETIVFHTGKGPASEPWEVPVLFVQGEGVSRKLSRLHTVRGAGDGPVAKPPRVQGEGVPRGVRAHQCVCVAGLGCLCRCPHKRCTASVGMKLVPTLGPVVERSAAPVPNRAGTQHDTSVTVISGESFAARYDDDRHAYPAHALDNLPTHLEQGRSSANNAHRKSVATNTRNTNRRWSLRNSKLTTREHTAPFFSLTPFNLLPRSITHNDISTCAVPEARRIAAQPVSATLPILAAYCFSSNFFPDCVTPLRLTSSLATHIDYGATLDISHYFPVDA